MKALYFQVIDQPVFNFLEFCSFQRAKFKLCIFEAMLSDLKISAEGQRTIAQVNSQTVCLVIFFIKLPFRTAWKKEGFGFEEGVHKSNSVKAEIIFCFAPKCSYVAKILKTVLDFSALKWIEKFIDFDFCVTVKQRYVNSM